MRGFAQLRKQSEKNEKINLLERFTVFFTRLNMPG